MSKVLSTFKAYDLPTALIHHFPKDGSSLKSNIDLKEEVQLEDVYSNCKICIVSRISVMNSRVRIKNQHHIFVQLNVSSLHVLPFQPSVTNCSISTAPESSTSSETPPTSGFALIGAPGFSIISLSFTNLLTIVEMEWSGKLDKFICTEL